MRVLRKGGPKYWRMKVECISNTGRLKEGTKFSSIKECAALFKIKAEDIRFDPDGMGFYVICPECGNKIDVNEKIPQCIQACVAHTYLISRM